MSETSNLSRKTESLITTGYIIIIVGAWGIYSFFNQEVGDFPSPMEVLSAVVKNSTRVADGLQVTTIEVIAGFALSIVIGMGVALVMSESMIARQSILPSLILLYSTPRAILAPLFLVWFGMNTWSIALYVSWFGFFPVFISSLTGFSQVPQELHHLGHLTNASRWQFFKNFKLWVALPYSLSGVKVAIPAAIEGAIIAEFIATGQGSGHIITTSLQLLEEPLVIGVILLLILFSTVFFKLIEMAIEYIVPVPVEDLT